MGEAEPQRKPVGERVERSERETVSQHVRRKSKKKPPVEEFWFFFFLMSDNGGRELAENMMSTDWTQAGVGLD